MATAEQARQLLSLHGTVRPQVPTDWNGLFPLPAVAERYYLDVGPSDVYIRSYGNSFFLPSLAKLWKFQAGYRWNGLSGEPIAEWDDDWLVVADQGGDPFILSRSSGVVLNDVHGMGYWEPRELFSDLNTMAACLAQLGAVVVTAGQRFTDDDCLIRPEFREEAKAGLARLLDSSAKVELVLGSLDWG